MKPNPIMRLVALLLAPCLANGSVGAGLVPARIEMSVRHRMGFGQAQGLPLQYPFASQALALEQVTELNPDFKKPKLEVITKMPRPSSAGLRLALLRHIGAAAAMRRTRPAVTRPPRTFEIKIDDDADAAIQLTEGTYPYAELAEKLGYDVKTQPGWKVSLNPADPQHMDQFRRNLRHLNDGPGLRMRFICDDPQNVRVIWKPAWAASQLQRGSLYSIPELTNSLQLGPDDNLIMVVNDLNRDLEIPIVIQIQQKTTSTSTKGKVVSFLPKAFIHPVDLERLAKLDPVPITAAKLAQQLEVPMRLLDPMIAKLNHNLNFPFWILRNGRSQDVLVIRALNIERMVAVAEKLYKKELQKPMDRLDAMVKTLQTTGYDENLLKNFMKTGNNIGRKWTYTYFFSTQNRKETASAQSFMKYMVKNELARACGYVELVLHSEYHSSFFNQRVKMAAESLHVIKRFREKMRIESGPSGSA